MKGLRRFILLIVFLLPALNGWATAAIMPAAAMRASGLDYETLRAVKPDIILASATAYGEGGPSRLGAS